MTKVVDAISMDGVKLPIDVVPGTDPPVFRWKQLVDGPSGRTVVEHMEAMPPTVEVAVSRLIAIVKQLLFDNAALRGQVQGHCDRIAAQSELLSKRAESQVAGATAASSSSRGSRGKG